ASQGAGVSRHSPLSGSPKGDRRTEQVPESVDRSSLLIDTEKRPSGQLGDLSGQALELFDRFDVPPKKNHRPGRMPLEDPPLRRGEGRAGDADAEKPHEERRAESIMGDAA